MSEIVTPDTPPPARRPLRQFALLASLLALTAGALVACGGSSKSSSGGSANASPAASPSGAAGRGAGTGQGRSGPPATFGVAAAIAGKSIEVQDPNTGQVTVNYTAGTTFAQTRTVTAAAIAVGDCVTAIGARATGTSGSAPASPGATAAQSFTALTVAVSPAVNGSCATNRGAGGFGGGFGGGRGVRPSGAPTGQPSDRPSGAAGRGFGSTAAGKVTAHTGDVLQIAVTPRATGTSASAGAAGGSPSTATVTLTAATTITQTAPATSAALKVGECVTAIGPAGSTGAVTATRITLSTPGPSGCTVGFGRRPGASPSSTAA